MPFYDYRCSEGHLFEKVVPIADRDNVQECPCGATGTRVMSPVRMKFKNPDPRLRPERRTAGGPTDRSKLWKSS